MGDHDEGKGNSKENDIMLLGKQTFNMFPSRKDCFLQSPYVHMNIHM
jgi:hypothetical protein